MNQSKVKSPRFWEIWRSSGAVGTYPEPSETLNHTPPLFYMVGDKVMVTRDRSLFFELTMNDSLKGKEPFTISNVMTVQCTCGSDSFIFRNDDFHGSDCARYTMGHTQKVELRETEGKKRRDGNNLTYSGAWFSLASGVTQKMAAAA